MTEQKSKEKNYYDLLGVSFTASEPEIRKAYRDKIRTGDLRSLNQALYTLTSAQRRLEYDNENKINVLPSTPVMPSMPTILPVSGVDKVPIQDDSGPFTSWFLSLPDYCKGRLPEFQRG